MAPSYRFLIVLAALLSLVLAVLLLTQLTRSLEKTAAVFEATQAKPTSKSSLSDAQDTDLSTQKELSVLDNLLQQHWSDEGLVLDSAQQNIASREDFVNASKDARNVRELMLYQASAAPLDEQGRYLLLNNNRFFSISPRDDQILSERTLFLHYAGINEKIEPPIVKVTPYFSTAAKSNTISHGSTVSLSKLINTQVTTNALLLPVARMVKTSNAWIIHVDTINALGLGPRRYFVVFD